MSEENKQLTTESFQKLADLAKSCKDLLEGATNEQRNAVADVLARAVPSASPPGWSKSSVASYYREKYALEVKILLDKIKLDREHDHKIRSNQFRTSRKTYYQKLTQGWLYLIDRLDPSGEYKELRKNICLKREKDGIRFKWALNEADDIELEAVEPEHKRDLWRTELQDFLNNVAIKDGQVLELNNLDLNTSELVEIQQLIDTIEGFYLLKLTKNRVQIAKQIQIP